MLTGKKTYIVAAATVLYAAVGYFLGYVDTTTAIQLLSTGLGMAGLRNAL